MARSLHIVERVVPDDGRAAYLAQLARRRQQAAAVQAHFWAFEHAGEAGRFVEFTEAPSEEALAAACGHADGAVTEHWTEVRIPA